jgi:hypothetical protein
MSGPFLIWLVALFSAGDLGAADSVGLSVLLEARMAASRGVNLLLTHQRADGSWAGDPVTTAQVLICLENAPDQAGEARRAAIVAQAVEYLRHTVADACAPAPGAAGPPDSLLSTEALSAALTALARDSVTAHRDLLSRGRARLLASVRPLDLSGGTVGVSVGPAPGGSAEAVWTTCTALDALLVTEGLDPPWNREGYEALTAYLREAWQGLLRSAPAAVQAAPPVAAAAPGAPEPVCSATALVRALLCLGVNPAEPLMASPLARWAQAPSQDPAAVFALAEALSLAGSDTGSPAAALAGWRDRLLEALLGTQQGDGGWPAAAGAGPRDRSTALALRAIQVAAGRRLAESEPASP